MITITFSLKVMYEGMDWIPLVHDEDQRREGVSITVNL
jgi:hypothetical protein